MCAVGPATTKAGEHTGVALIDLGKILRLCSEDSRSKSTVSPRDTDPLPPHIPDRFGLCLGILRSLLTVAAFLSFCSFRAAGPGLSTWGLR